MFIFIIFEIVGVSFEGAFSFVDPNIPLNVWAFSKSNHRSSSIKKLLLKILQYSKKTPVLEYLFNKVAGL